MGGSMLESNLTTCPKTGTTSIIAIDASDKQQLLPCLIIRKGDVPAPLHESDQPNSSFPNLIGPPIFATGDFDLRV